MATPNTNTVQPVICLFDGHGYIMWRQKAISYLKLKGVWLQISNPEDVVVNEESSTDTKERETKAIAHLESILAEDILNMFPQNVAHNLWKVIEERY